MIKMIPTPDQFALNHFPFIWKGTHFSETTENVSSCNKLLVLWKQAGREKKLFIWNDYWKSLRSQAFKIDFVCVSVSVICG